MVIFLQGPDEYRRRVKREAVVAAFLKKHGVSGVGRFDAEIDAEEPAAFLKNQSMFAPVRLAVVENPFAGIANTLPELAASLLEDPHTTILLSDPGKPPKGWAFLAKPKGKKGAEVLIQTFEYLSGVEWTAFIRAEAKARGLTLSAGAAKLLSAVYAKDTWRLVTELDKLALLGREISEADLGHLASDLAPDFWAFVNSFRSPDLGVRLAALESAFSRNEPAAKLFHILAYQMKGKLPRFAAYDLAVKSGKLEYEEALVDAIL